MFGKCKVCAEKDKRIADLRAEIESLRTLVFPAVAKKSVSLVDLERDKLLSANSDFVPPTNFDLEQEAAAIITGAYDQSNQVEVQ